MNGMATSGKNLQTVFAVAEVKGAPDYAPCSAILSVVQIANIIDYRGVF